MLRFLKVSILLNPNLKSISKVIPEPNPLLDTKFSLVCYKKLHIIQKSRILKGGKREEVVFLNRQIFQVIRTAGRTISGILLKLDPMGPFWEIVNCASYFGSQLAHMGVEPHPRFQCTE